jgi:hypothetical protein
MTSANAYPDDIEALKAMLLERDARIGHLEDVVESQKAANATAKAEIEHLKLLIAKLRRMQFGRKSEKLDRQIEQLELGSAVRIGWRQSMPSSNIDSWAWLRHTTPPPARGHTNRPQLGREGPDRRFIRRHMPSPLHHSTLTRSPRLPRNTNTWPLNGSRSSSVRHLEDAS